MENLSIDLYDVNCRQFRANDVFSPQLTLIYANTFAFLI